MPYRWQSITRTNDNISSLSHVCIARPMWINTWRPRRNEQHFADDIFKRISSMKMFEFLIKFPWSLFPMVQLTIFQHWFRLWLGAVQATSHYLNQWLLILRIYASLGLNELTNWTQRFTSENTWSVVCFSNLLPFCGSKGFTLCLAWIMVCWQSDDRQSP